MWTDRAADTLLGYAYMQRGVEKVDLEIDPKKLSVTFKVKLETKSFKRYNKVNAMNAKPSLWNKFFMLRLMKKGVPAPGSIEKTISYMARSYLPSNYKVEVQLVS